MNRVLGLQKMADVAPVEGDGSTISAGLCSSYSAGACSSVSAGLCGAQ